MEVIYFMKNIAQSEQKYVVSYEISNYLFVDMFKRFVQRKIKISERGSMPVWDDI
jgi:hypothetical protein